MNFLKYKILNIFLFLLICSNSYSATVTLPTTYVNGGTVTATNLNGNFSALATPINGGLDNTNANTASGYRFFEIKSSLPGTGSQGRVVFNTADNSLNLDNGSAWLSTITPSGTLATGKIPYYNSGWTLLTPGANNLPLVSNGATSLPSYRVLPLTSGVTGTLPIANGGTGTTTANLALNALLPSQTSNSGKFLTTNGTNSSWATTKNVEVFTSSGTWTCPTGVNYVKVTLIGGGGGGGGGRSSGGSGAGGGGGSSSSITGYVGKVTPGNSYAVVVGAAGTAGVAGTSNPSSDGGDGGNSSFTFDADSVVAVGGAKGTGYPSETGGSGASAGSTLNASAGSGGSGYNKFAGGNGANGVGTQGGGGGACALGGGGGNGGNSASGTDGRVGGGGGAGGDNNPGGAGGVGIVIIEYNANGAPS